MINKPVTVIKAIKNVKLQSAIYIILFMIIVKYYGTIRDRGNTDDYFGYIAIMLIIQLVTFIYHLFYDVRRIEIYDNGEIKYLHKIINRKNSKGLPINPIPPTQQSISGGSYILHKDKIDWWSTTYNSKLELYFKHLVSRIQLYFEHPVSRIQ
mgnify:CR=1 FL=1